MPRFSWLAPAIALLALGCAPESPGAIPNSPATVLEISAPTGGEMLSDDYVLTVNGQRVPVYVCRVSAEPFNGKWPGRQRSLEHTELAAFACWDMSGPAQVEVVSQRPIRPGPAGPGGLRAPAVAIRPTARGIKPEIDHNRIRFQLDKPGPLTVEVGGTRRALHLFPSPPKPEAYAAIEKAAAAEQTAGKNPGLIYFGPGIHSPGRMTLESNQTVYLAGGAFVYGSFQATGASNIRILGRGVLDSSRQERGRPGGGGCIRLNNCTNVEVEGVVLRDPDVWCFTLQNCSKVNISNVKLVGLWRFNSDGIDLCNCQDVTLRDCFIRSFDDSIVIKGLVRGRDANAAAPRSVERILADRCVLWCDWGRALEIGAETVATEMNDITFRNCDVIHTDFAAMDIQNGDRAAVRNVLYDNIRVEIDPVSYEGVFYQESDSEKYVAKPGWVPRLLVIEIVKNVWSRDENRGSVDGVTARNITVTGPHHPSSRVGGFDANHMARNVTIENLRVRGRLIRSLEDANVILKPFVENVRLDPPGGAKDEAEMENIIDTLGKKP